MNYFLRVKRIKYRTEFGLKVFFNVTKMLGVLYGHFGGDLRLVTYCTIL